MPRGNKDPETDEAWVAHSFFMPLRLQLLQLGYWGDREVSCTPILSFL